MIIVFENNTVHLQLHRFTLTRGDLSRCEVEMRSELSKFTGFRRVHCYTVLSSLRALVDRYV